MSSRRYFSIGIVLPSGSRTYWFGWSLQWTRITTAMMMTASAATSFYHDRIRVRCAANIHFAYIAHTHTRYTKRIHVCICVCELVYALGLRFPFVSYTCIVKQARTASFWRRTACTWRIMNGKKAWLLSFRLLLLYIIYYCYFMGNLFLFCTCFFLIALRSPGYSIFIYTLHLTPPRLWQGIFFPSLDGNFSIAWMDLNSRSIICVRDSHPDRKKSIIHHAVLWNRNKWIFFNPVL